MRISLVEDRQVRREMMTPCLRAGGFVTDVVGRDDEAIAASSSNLFDVVLLDLGATGPGTGSHYRVAGAVALAPTCRC